MQKSLACGLLFLALSITGVAKTRPGRIESVSVSPSGKLLAVDFVKGDTSFIYVIDVETGVARRLTDAKEGEEAGPSFSADGKRIAFTYWPASNPWPGGESRPRIVIENIDGTERQEWLLPASNLLPVFSIDQKTIVFASRGFYGSPIAQQNSHFWGFFAASLDGTDVRQLTTEHFYLASRPSISPDGKNMVVVTEGLETSQQIAVYSIIAPGPPLHTFRPHIPNEISHKEPIFNCPNYLPDGSILFMAADKYVDYDVYRLDPDTGRIEKLTNWNSYSTELTVSADGKTAAFLRWTRNLSGVKDPEPYLLDVESHKLTPLKVSGLPD